MTFCKDEVGRQAALDGYNILDSPGEEAFDDIARLTAGLLEVPFVMISMVDNDRQWFKSHIGLEIKQTPRDVSFCQHAIGQPDVFIVPDATEDPRFASSPLVTSDPNVRFYAGAPLVTPEGYAVGTLCVMDTAPRVLSDEKAEVLKTLGQQVIAQLELRRNRFDLEEAETEINSQIDFLATIMDNVADGIYTVNENGIVTYINRSALEMLGWSEQQLMGRRIHDIIHYQYLSGSPLHWEDCFLCLPKSTSGIVRGREDYFVRQDGTMFPVLCSSAPLRQNGQTSGLVFAFTDDTDRKNIDKERREYDDQLRTLADNVGALLGRIDIYERYTFCNQCYVERFGLQADQIIGRSVREVHGDEVYEIVRDSLLRALSGETMVFEAVLPGFEHNVRHVHMTYTPEYDVYGEVSSIVISAIDVTDRRVLEKQLAQAQKLESIGQLAAGIAHELNTPIQYIGHNARFLRESFADLQRILSTYRMLADSVKNSQPTDDDLKSLDNLVVSVDLEYLLREVPNAISESLEGIERVATIVGAMKEFSHPGVTDRSLVDINRVIQSTTIVSKHDWKHVAEMVMELDSDLPQVPCLPGEINQVLLNVIVNAAQALGEVVTDEVSGKGTITISTKKVSVDCKPFAEIRVGDTGPGIRPDILPRIFDPFFTTKEVGKGTGQGLAIAHSIVVKKHQGTIDCESELGRGATFIIRLPLSAEESNQ